MAEGEKIVNLNVGGRPFSVSANTLKAEPASKLANIVDGQGIKDESGIFHIESCPHLFDVVLNWCRFKVKYLEWLVAYFSISGVVCGTSS